MYLEHVLQPQRKIKPLNKKLFPLSNSFANPKPQFEHTALSLHKPTSMFCKFRSAKIHIFVRSDWFCTQNLYSFQLSEGCISLISEFYIALRWSKQCFLFINIWYSYESSSPYCTKYVLHICWSMITEYVTWFIQPIT